MDDVVRNRSQVQVNFGQLLFRLNNQDRSLVRNLEKLYRKQIQSSYGVVFNETCLNENLLPKYTDIRTHDPGVRYEDCTFKFRRDLLILNLDKSKQEFHQVTEEIRSLEARFNELVCNDSLRSSIIEELDSIKRTAKEETSCRTIRKLNRMYHGSVCLPENITPYINLSSHELNKE